MAEVSLRELADAFGFQYRANGKMDCPFCGKRRGLKLTFEKQMWNCPHCKTGGGVLHMYAKYQLGWSSIPNGREERKALSEEVQRFCGYEPEQRAEPKPWKAKAREPIPTIPAASDDVLDLVYRAMADMPELVLTEEHRASLLKRGLSFEDIQRNGYRSIPRSCQIPAMIHELYEALGGDSERKRIFSDYKYPKSQVLLGLYIAQYLQDRGFSLKGVPGFFLFGKEKTGQRWCLNYSPGILIPTRNYKGQIVCWQVRAMKGGSKYLTVSCSSLPGAVNDAVSRCHFPLGNAKLTAQTVLLITEGPLKADVAISLENRSVAFAAIHGINSTKDLIGLIPFFRSLGINSVYNALDMDRLTNPNVRKGSKELFGTFRSKGMEVNEVYWGKACAEFMLFRFEAVARTYSISYEVPFGANVFERLAIVSSVVLEYENPQTEKKLNPCEYIAADGTVSHYYWEPKTKGIDDYQFSLR